MDYEKLCSHIFKIDPKIRFTAVYNFWAERIAGGMKEGLDSHLAEKITINSINQALLITFHYLYLLKSRNQSHGKGKIRIQSDLKYR